MNRINKNLFIVIVLLIILVFTCSFTYLANAGECWDIRIKAVSGDINALNNVNIAGTIIDSNFALQFNLKNGGSIQNLIKNQKAVNSFYSSYWGHTWDRLTYDTAQYEISFMDISGTHIRITRRLFDKNNNFVSYDVANLSTGYRSKSNNIIDDNDIGLPDTNSNISSSGSSSSGSASNSATVTEKQSLNINLNSHVTIMQVLDGKLYFIIPKLRDYTGNSGLYVIDGFDRNNIDAGIRKLAEIPLNEEDDETIILGKIDDKLCLIRKNPGKVSMQLFNMEKQAFEAEYNDLIASDNKAQSEQLYAVYSSPGYISLVISGENGFNFYTYGFQGKISRVSTINGYKSEEGMREFSLFYANDFLYMIRNKIVWPGQNSENLQYQRNPDELIYIIAYDSSGDMVFKGELEARQNDDNIRQSKFNKKLEEDNKYSYIPYRRFLKIELSTK